MAAVSALGGRSPAGGAASPKQLLLLQPSGQLALYQAGRQLCLVALPGGPEPAAAAPSQGRQPVFDDEDMMTSPAASAYSVPMDQATPAATATGAPAGAEGPLQVVALGREQGNSLAVGLADGSSRRVSLQLASASALVRHCLEALQAALQPEDYHSVLAAYVQHPGEWRRSGWVAGAAALRRPPLRCPQGRRAS